MWGAASVERCFFSAEDTWRYRHIGEDAWIRTPESQRRITMTGDVPRSHVLLPLLTPIVGALTTITIVWVSRNVYALANLVVTVNIDVCWKVCGHKRHARSCMWCCIVPSSCVRPATPACTVQKSYALLPYVAIFHALRRSGVAAVRNSARPLHSRRLAAEVRFCWARSSPKSLQYVARSFPPHAAAFVLDWSLARPCD